MKNYLILITTKIFFFFLVFTALFILGPHLAIAEVNGIGAQTVYPSGDDTDGIYYINTEDNVKVVLKHYRPFHTDSFNNGTPIVLFNGITTTFKMWDIRTTKETRNLYDNLDINKYSPAEWIKNDEYIKKDPMLYYSMAYHLWKFGYDVWLFNYRGTGVGKHRSALDSQGISLDQWAVYDTPAAIDKVIELTGKKPIIGGHSTGGFVAYAYLQGTYFDKVTGHVRNSVKLAEKRNKKVAAMIGLDPAGTPPLPQFINISPVWAVIGSPIFVPLGDILLTAANTPGVNYLLSYKSPAVAIAQELFASIFYLDEFTSNDGLLSYIAFMNTKNINKYLMDYLLRYIETGFPIRGYGQFYDMGLHNTIREFWKNGDENKNKIIGPKPTANDGYYYYKNNMHLITVPMLTILSETESSVSPEISIKDIVLAKKFNEMDETHIIPNSAHIDLYLGDIPATATYYIWRDWLNRLQKTGYLK